MEFTADFNEAVQNGKVTRVKIMLKDSLLLNRDRNDFDQMLDYAQSKLPSLIDKHDGEIFKPTSEWDEKYLNEQMVKVVNNFSNERIQLLREMVNQLFEDKDGKNENTVKVNHSKNEGLSSMQQAGMAVATLGIITAISGIMIKGSVATVLSVSGGVGILVGGMLYIKGKDY
ncbi:MAG: hypothetical protein Q4B93_05425 [Clostridia bacterium]|nr:hypothetical protein [Clostridia bacterium]